MKLLAIDPGTAQSAYVIFDGTTILLSGLVDNSEIRSVIIESDYDAMAVEMVASYGMPVGAEVFETCVWIGRFVELGKVATFLCYRKDIKVFLCGTTKAKDGNVRQALIDLIGTPGTKLKPGPTYGIKSDIWSALAVAAYVTFSQETSAVVRSKSASGEQSASDLLFLVPTGHHGHRRTPL